MIPYFWTYENFKGYFLGPLENMVLYFVGRTHFNHVSVFGHFHFKRKMVSLLLYNGSDLGQVYFIWNGF
jgi:hypothetical protein